MGGADAPPEEEVFYQIVSLKSESGVSISPS